MTLHYPWRVRALCVAAVLSSFACNLAAPPGDSSEGNTGQTASALWANGTFETGPAGSPPPSWTIATFLDPGVTVQTPQTRAGLNLGAGGTALTNILRSAAGPETMTDPNLGAAASLRWPKFGNQCVLVNNGGKNKNVNDLSQQMTVAAGDVDPTDNLVHVRFVAAPVLENPSHAAAEQPYYFVQLTNDTTGAILYTDFNLSAQAGVPWKISNGFYYTDWQLVDIAPGAAKLKVGDKVTLEVIGSGCSLGGHFGQIYVDGVGTTLAALYTSGTAPAQANAGTNLPYTINYKNGSATAAAGVAVDFNLPPNTTFVSLTAPGLVCTTPAVGAAGLVHCTIGALAAGASGSFQITVAINAAATGTLVAGNYSISGTLITPLLGSKIKTTIGCTADTDCATGTWCNEALSKCTPTLANGVAIPTDAPHTNPTLDGTCTAPAATLVCTSAVCDTADKACGFGNGTGPCSAANAAVVCRSAICDVDAKCGYANGDGPCTAANAAALCRSLVCDPDLKCGFAVNDGPCTVANGPTVCRTGACSVNGKCEPAGGCNVDGDCTGGNWCKEATHVCTPKLANGTAVPTDAPHTNPTLNGTCTAPAATLVCSSLVCDTVDNACGFSNGKGPCNAGNAGVVCRSGACDPDTKCGFAVGDGPCTVANGPVVCRSGACSVNGTCEPAGGCNTDGDCTGGAWCTEATHVCTPKLSNGTALPTDAPHTNPTLNGTCTAPAATLVCSSLVCDAADSKCGYADGDGPCTALNGATVCRSMSCSKNGLCAPAGGCNVDGDCAGGNWCKQSTHQCSAKLANGAALPTDAPHTNPTLDGTCTAAASALVCTSLVCDTADNECGYANGHGPCTVAEGGVVCRSGKCAPMGNVCVPAGGCAVDGDCDATQWCNTSSLTCVAKLPNGQPVPTVTGHTPALSGTCTPGAGAAVCASGACDPTDNLCGLATGDGPCAAPPQCRSGKCSSSSVCIECTNDGECSAAQYCSAAGKCTAKRPNSDPCAAGDQCLSAVCGPDKACGLPDGQPCTAPAECRTNACTNAACGGGGAGAGAGAGNAATPSSLAASLEGGGCACSEGPRSGGSSGALAVGLMATLGWAARRRRRAVSASRSDGV